MARVTKIVRIDDSLGVILPDGLLEEMGLGEGDELLVLFDGRDLKFTRRDPDLEKILDAFDAGRKQYHETLQKLADS